MTTDPLYEAVAKIARHCWRGVHWEKGPKGPRPVREPLKKHHLERHINGGPGVGLAPIAPGESTTRIAVLDFDSHKGEVPWDDMVRKALNVADILDNKGINAIPFRSSGGRGIHLICLWDEPQDAYSVRELMREVLGIMQLKPGTKGVKHGEVEIFPKQDSVPGDGLGSMFILPLTGESLPLDPATYEVLGYEYAEAMVEWPKSQPVPVLAKPSTTEQTSSTIDPASLPTSLADVRSALAAIPNEGDESLDYDSWRDVIFAVHHATDGSAEGLALAHEFSKRSPKYDPEFLDERVWPYIRHDRGGAVITAASLFHRARQHGWAEDIINEFEILPPEDDEPSSDVAPHATPPAGKPERFAVVPIGAFAQRKHPGWIVRSVLPRAEVALIIGESGAGKSFLAFDLACAISTGAHWRGLKTRTGRVVYIVAEGAGFFHQRVLAHVKHHDLSLDALQIGVVSDSPNLLQKEDVRSLVQQLHRFGKVDVVIVDTFAQVTPGANENAAEDMGRALAHCKTIHQATGALVVLVHHVGKDESKGARGWSGLKAAADAEITVLRRDQQRTAVVSKMKDGPDGLEMPFKLVEVVIGEDEEGEPITSCVVQHLEASESSRERRQPAGDNARRVWECACNLAALDDTLMVGELIDAAITDMPYDPQRSDRRREKAQRAINALMEQGFIRVENNRVRLLGGER